MASRLTERKTVVLEVSKNGVEITARVETSTGRQRGLAMPSRVGISLSSTR
jgi:hypothetical protein